MSASTLVGYTLPQTLVHQQVTQQVRNTIADLQPVIIGPQFDLKRYDNPDEKRQIGVGRYTGGTAATYPWPARPVGGIPDQEWTKVFVDDAYLRYWTSVNQLNLVANTRNHITDPTTVWTSYDEWAQSAALPARGVKVGDGIRVRVPAANVDLLTQIIDFVHDRVDAEVDPVEAYSGNKASAPASGVATYEFGPTGVTPPVGTVDAAAYTGLADKLYGDVYSVSCIVGPSGSDNTPVRFLVTSTAGDNSGTSVALTGTGDNEVELGDRGAILAFDLTDAAFAVGQTWKVSISSAYTPPTVTSGGAYTGAYDSTYILTVVRSGVIGGAVPPQFEITVDNGADRGLPTFIGADPITLGSYGVTVTFAGTTVAEGDQYFIHVSPEQAGPIHTIVLAHSLPADVTTVMPIQIELMMRKDIVLDPNRRGEPPLKNYIITDTGVLLGDILTHFDPELVDDNGTQLRLEIVRGDVYIQYRSLLLQNSYAVQEFFPENITSLESVVGEVTRDNPIALGLSMALQNSAVDASVGVLYITLQSNDYAGYAKAVDMLVGRVGAYGLTPLTQDPRVHDLVVAHVRAMSTAENGRWRVCWLNSASNDTLGIVTGTESEPVMATLEAAPEDNGDILTVRWEDGRFITDGVRSGDFLRVNYRSDGFDDVWSWDEYVIDRVISEDSVKLYRSADRETAIPIKIEVWRQLTSREQAETYGKTSAQFADRRVRHIWPPKAIINGGEVEGYYLCALLAGRRASALPQQGLTNLPLYGVDSVPMTTELMNGEDLNLMASLGTWIITQNPATGVIYTRHQLTTGEYGNLNECEDSLVTNLDSVSYQYLRAFESYIGRVNVTDASISQLKAEWLLVTQQMQVAQVPMLGPQLVTVELISFAQHPLLPDRVLATAKCSGPQPFNNFDLFLVV
jgi:hypothetical protein